MNIDAIGNPCREFLRPFSSLFVEAFSYISKVLVFCADRVMYGRCGCRQVQRVPSNSTRLHTSAASVVVMMEAEEVDVKLEPR